MWQWRGYHQTALSFNSADQDEDQEEGPRESEDEKCLLFQFPLKTRAFYLGMTVQEKQGGRVEINEVIFQLGSC